jgi:hypothetical protein
MNIIVFYLCHVAVFTNNQIYFIKNSPMQPFVFIIIFNKTTCFEKIKFSSSGPRYTIHSVAIAMLVISCI